MKSSSFKKKEIRTRKLFLCSFFIILLIPIMTATNIMAEEKSNTISFDLVESAQITKIDYYLKVYKGQETVHFEIAVKNISNSGKRFKVQIFIDDGPSASYYYPLKAKPPQKEPIIESGKFLVETIPLVFYDKIPNKFLIIIKEM